MDAVKIDALGLCLTSLGDGRFAAHPERDGRGWHVTAWHTFGHHWTCEIAWRGVTVTSDYADSLTDAYDGAKELAHELIPAMYAELFAWEAQVYRERVKERHGDVRLTEDEEAVY